MQSQGLSYFASPVLLGTNGIEKILPLPQLDDFETKKLQEAVPELKVNIQKGIEYAQKQP